MGLDMYLFCNSKEVVSKAWSNQPDAWRIMDGQVAYWRKENAIHKWFVENVQHGNDDCGTYYVEVEQLQELLKIVTTVLDSTELVDAMVRNGYSFDHNMRKVYHYQEGKKLKDTTVAEKLLPTTDGFFFGGTDYDEWYWDGLLYTKEQLERILSSVEEKKYKLFGDEGPEITDWMPKGQDDWIVKFQYHSSW